MNILHVTKKYPQALGGDAVVVASLYKQQRIAGHRVVIVTSNCDEIEDARHIYKFGLRDVPARLDDITLRRIMSLLALAFRMFGILGKERPDVIHTHSVDMAFFVSFAARWYHIPMIHTFHIVTFYDAAQPALRRKSELWLAKGAHPRQITAPNAYDVKKLQSAGLKQAVLLPNGVDLTFWGMQSNTVGEGKNIFVAVGRLENQKGYEHLIRAATLLVTRQPVAIVIIGHGSQETALRELIRNLGLEGSVTLVGQKSPEQIRALLATARAAVFPSLYETTPLTLLGAWASGTPAIATRVGILRDTPDDFAAAFVTPVGDDQSLAAAMQSCIENAGLRQAVATAGHREAKKYAWPAVARTLELMYQGAT